MHALKCRGLTPMYRSVLFLISCSAVAVAVAAGGSQGLQYSDPPKGQPPSPIKLVDGTIVSSTDSSGIHIKAAVWGGPTSEAFSSFVHITRPEGTANSSTSRALVNAAYQLHQQGYNAVYLPFCFSDLRDATSGGTGTAQGSSRQQCKQLSLTSGLSGGLGGSTSKHADQSSSSSSSSSLQAGFGGLTQPSTDGGAADVCRTILPNTTTLDRYLWGVQWFVANGVYVVISSSGNGGNGGIQNPAAVADAWAKLWRAAVALPAFETSLKGRLMLQLASDTAAQQWESRNGTDGVKVPGLQETYLATMDAVDRVAPGTALFILQGPQQQAPAGYSQAQWGSGFSTEPGLLRLGSPDPTPLFKALLTKSYRNQIILSPRTMSAHPSSSVLDPAATAASPAPAAAIATPEWSDVEAPADAAVPTKVLDTSFYQLSHRGFCVSEGNCLRFPVAVMQQQQPDAILQDPEGLGRDLVLFADFVLSQQSRDAAEDVATGNWYHWDVTPPPTTTQPSPEPQQGAASKVTTDGAGAVKGDSSKHSTDKDKRGALLTFVYAADGGDGENGEVFAIRDLQAADVRG